MLRVPWHMSEATAQGGVSQDWAILPICTSLQTFLRFEPIQDANPESCIFRFLHLALSPKSVFKQYRIFILSKKHGTINPFGQEYIHPHATCP